MHRRLAVAVVFLVVLALPVLASNTRLSGADGHPRSRFPLTIYVEPAGDSLLESAVTRAVNDWNAMARETLGVTVFASATQLEQAQVTTAFVDSNRHGLMGETDINVSNHVILLPVRIEIVRPQARGQTSRETLLYQVLAHELGHAVGLDHVRDPASIMCCVTGSIDFKDPVAREAYVEARRHPDVRSAAAQLRAHYARVWDSSGAETPR